MISQVADLKLSAMERNAANSNRLGINIALDWVLLEAGRRHDGACRPTQKPELGFCDTWAGPSPSAAVAPTLATDNHSCLFVFFLLFFSFLPSFLCVIWTGSWQAQETPPITLQTIGVYDPLFSWAPPFLFPFIYLIFFPSFVWHLLFIHAWDGKTLPHH